MRFYNVTRGPLSVSLASGKALTVPPKSWVDVDPADAGSARLQSLIGKGFLKRSVLPDPEPVVSATEPVSEPAVSATEPVSEPAVPRASRTEVTVEASAAPVASPKIDRLGKKP